jgi:hypothetical protein
LTAQDIESSDFQGNVFLVSMRGPNLDQGRVNEFIGAGLISGKAKGECPQGGNEGKKIAFHFLAHD